MTSPSPVVVVVSNAGGRTAMAIRPQSTAAEATELIVGSVAR